MKCKVYLILTTLFLFLPHCVFAEEETEGRKTGVTGFVLNQDMEPIAHAKVMLFSRTFIEYPEKNEHGRTWEYDEGEQTTETDEYGHYYFQVDPVRENSWVRVSAEGYPDYKGYYTLKLQEGSEVQNIIISNTARYRAGQYATIIMPTPPDAALGRFFRLDRVENGKVIFEREQNPQADVPYIIIPDKDFEIPCDTTLKQMAGKTDVEGAYLKGQEFVDFAKEKGTSCIMCHEQPSIEKLQRTGVVELDANNKVLGMEEKPQVPKSHWAVPPFYIYLKKDLDLVRHSVENGCGKDAPGNLAHYMVEHTTMHAWQMSAGRFDIGSLDTYYEAVEKYGK